MKTLEILICIVTFAAFIGAILFCLFKPNDWARCMSCGIFHNAKTGRQSWELPASSDGVIEHRFCPDCSKPFLQNLGQPQTKALERKPGQSAQAQLISSEAKR